MILFLDEFHTILGTGAAEGALDAANILKPALARGRLQMIGATTRAEYKKTIETDGALERRFVFVEVGEPSPEVAGRMLAAQVSGLERHHRIAILPEAVTAAVSCSARCMPERRLPDKALDLLDEASAALRLSAEGIEKPALTASDVEQTAFGNTGVPCGVKANERLTELAARLNARIFGQEQAVSAVASAVRRGYAGFRDESR